jgi:hypothetical protein
LQEAGQYTHTHQKTITSQAQSLHASKNNELTTKRKEDRSAWELALLAGGLITQTQQKNNTKVVGTT